MQSSFGTLAKIAATPRTPIREVFGKAVKHRSPFRF